MNFYTEMRLRIYSEITLNPLVKEISNTKEDVQVSSEYVEDLVPYIMTFDVESLHTDDLIYIHFDNYFQKADSSKLINLLKSVHSLAGLINNIILISNSFLKPFKNTSQKNTVGKWSDFWVEEQDLLESVLETSNIYFIDFLDLIMETGLETSYNFELGHLYQMPYSKTIINKWSDKLINQIEFHNRSEKKVIVLDCDNTLWGGVLGEEGKINIACDLNADGIVYHQFQEFLKSRKEEGFLLTLCSKNDHEDVKEAFQDNNFPLKWEDFIVAKVNWEDKYKNIQSIADELNVGLDSLIFIDDSDFEGQSVKNLLPEVAVLSFRNEYVHFLNLIDSDLFTKKLVLDADKNKTDQYKAQQSRSAELKKYDNLESYIESLNIQLDIRVNDRKDLKRLSQLTEKTNQFNFNKHYYAPNELENIIKNGHKLFSLKVSDKYGDYGTVGLIILSIEEKQVTIENYIMSCRVLGRNIEKKFFDYVLNDLQSKNIELNEVKFLKTNRNTPAEKFYKQYI